MTKGFNAAFAWASTLYCASHIFSWLCRSDYELAAIVAQVLNCYMDMVLCSYVFIVDVYGSWFCNARFI